MADKHTEENRQRAIRFIELLGKGVLDDELLAPDPHWWIPGLGTVPRAEFEGFVKSFHELCTGTPVMQIDGVTADGDRVAIEARCDAELVNGVAYHNTYHFLLEFENGKIKLAKEYNDTQHSGETVAALIMQQSARGK